MVSAFLDALGPTSIQGGGGREGGREKKAEMFNDDLLKIRLFLSNAIQEIMRCALLQTWFSIDRPSYDALSNHQVSILSRLMISAFFVSNPLRAGFPILSAFFTSPTGTLLARAHLFSSSGTGFVVLSVDELSHISSQLFLLWPRYPRGTQSVPLASKTRDCWNFRVFSLPRSGICGGLQKKAEMLKIVNGQRSVYSKYGYPRTIIFYFKHGLGTDRYRHCNDPNHAP